jgi:hypothetical protein
MGGLVLIYFILSSIFILSLEKITFAPLMSLNGIKLIFWFLLSVGFISFTLIYVATFALWLGAKCFHGRGNFLQTRAAVIWTLITGLPIGFMLLILSYIFRHPDLGPLLIYLKTACLLGILVLLVYGFIVLVKTISEIHQIGSWKGFFSIVLGLVILTSMILVTFPYLSGLWN